MLISKTPLCVAAAAAVACSLPMSATAQELIQNGDFEAAPGTFPTGFTDEFIFDGTFTLTSDAAGGVQAGLIENAAPGSASNIKFANLGIGEVVAGQEVTVSFDAKGTQGVAGVVFAELFSELDGEGTSKSEILGGGPLGLTDQYQNFAFTTTLGPDVAGGISLQFNAATGAVSGSTAEVFFDNVSIVPEPASAAALMGLGGLAMLRRRKA
jgi:hypothetical protein